MKRAVFSCLAASASAQLLVGPSSNSDEGRKIFTTVSLGDQSFEASLTLQQPTLCDAKVKQHSGYFQVGTSKKLFFWMFESRSKPASDPLVMWLTGGPGCSSMLALLAENGPCTVEKDGKTTKNNPSSWNNNANVMWIDQPAGTGFSAGLPTPNEKAVGADVYVFLQAFFKGLPQYSSHDFYVTGESYAGHYIPAVTHAIWAGNKQASEKINLKGFMIGNGLVNPAEQYKWYAEMAHTAGRAEGGTGPPVINSTFTYGIMKAAIGPCVALIKSCEGGSKLACTAAYVTCNYGEMMPYTLTGQNPYDMRIKCEHGHLCYDFDPVAAYLNQPSVQQQLGVSKKWASCNMMVNMMFQQDWMQRLDILIPDMLADGIHALIYAGDCDFICNWLGNKHWTLAMEWPHQAEFNSAKDQAWTSGGKAAGRLRSANNFHFLQVYQAGHMVPMDQPEVALDMLNRFIANKLSSEEEVIVV